jgi:hypothetical protein
MFSQRSLSACEGKTIASVATIYTKGVLIVFTDKTYAYIEGEGGDLDMVAELCLYEDSAKQRRAFGEEDYAAMLEAHRLVLEREHRCRAEQQLREKRAQLEQLKKELGEV